MVIGFKKTVIKLKATSIARFTLLPLTLFIVSCSGQYTFDSNLDANSAKQYFSASKVNIYNDESEFTTNYTYIGLVEGEDCQEKQHLAAPDAINARTKARQLAFSKQANAIIFTQCVDIKTKQCAAQVVCYGKAYLVDDSTSSTGNEHD
jgi:RcsF protein